MAIQMRRGPLAQYDESKMLPGEWGISIDDDTNDQKAFVAFAPGIDKEVLFVEDAEERIEAIAAEAVAYATEQAKAWARGDGFHVNDYASGDGSTTAFTLTEPPASVLGVYVNGAETSAYTVSGAVITFTEAPAEGENNIRVYYTVNTTTDNAKYYKEHAASSASTATTQATKSQSYAVGGTSSRTGEDTDNAKYYKEQATTAATTATTNATKSQSYAVGGTSSRTGEDTDNAKYYKEQAEAAAAMLDAEKILGDFAHYESTTTASKAYAIGEYLTYNGYLYRVTAAISSGGTITIGTNVVQTNVGDEIKNKVLRFDSVSVSATTGNIATVSDSRITADHVVVECVWGNPSYITTNVTATTAAGSLTLNGTCTTATTATVTLVKKDN